MTEQGFRDQIYKGLAAAGAGPLEAKERELTNLFLGELMRWSGRVHLIGRSNIRSTIVSQFADSMRMLRFMEEVVASRCRDQSERGQANEDTFPGGSGGAVRVADVGAGAGFPGIVWKIFRPPLDVTLYERRSKQAAFLERVVTIMRQGGIRVTGGDAAECTEGGSYDIVVSKASGRLAVMAPVVEKLLAERGMYVTVKGRQIKEEISGLDESALSLEASRGLPGNRGAMLCFRFGRFLERA